MNTDNTDLQEKLQRLTWLAQRYVHKTFTNRGPRADATRGQGRVLAALKMQSEISTKDLAYVLGIRPQSLNELLAKLDRDGLIVREPSEADKRVVIVKITEKGRNEEPQTSDISHILDCLKYDEKQIFGEYLDRIIAALEAQVGESENDEFEWMNEARKRFGDNFDQLLRMGRGGRPGHRHGFGGGPRGAFGGDWRFGRPDDPRFGARDDDDPSDPRFGRASDPRFGARDGDGPKDRRGFADLSSVSDGDLRAFLSDLRLGDRFNDWMTRFSERHEEEPVEGEIVEDEPQETPEA